MYRTFTLLLACILLLSGCNAIEKEPVLTSRNISETFKSYLSESTKEEISNVSKADEAFYISQISAAKLEAWNKGFYGFCIGFTIASAFAVILVFTRERGH